MKKPVSGILALICLIPIITFGQHPIRGTVNTVSPVPNYLKGGRSTNPALLTDGKYSKSTILWLDPGTLGWERVPEITIDITLKQPSEIGKIALHTGMNPPTGVYLPLNIHVFTSLDKKTYHYWGDMTDVSKAGKGYQEIKLAFSGINAAARYVRLIVIPGGMFFFTDEIEIFSPGKAKAAHTPLQTLTIKEMAAFVSNEKEIAKERRFLLTAIDDRLGTADNTQKKKLQTIRNRINKDRLLNRRGRYEQYQREIAVTSIRKSGKQGLQVKKHTSPWGVNLGKTPGKGTTDWTDDAAVQLLTCVNATEYVAFSVANNNLAELNTRVEIESSPGLETALYVVDKIKARDFKSPPDILIPIKNGQNLKFYPGETKIIMAGLKPGNQGTLSAAMRLVGGKSNTELKFAVKALKPALAFQPGNRLNVDVWAYFYEPFLKGREGPAREDLLDHYVNTFVIPQHVSLSALVNSDFRMLNAYLKNLKGFRKVLLFMNFSDYLPTVKGYYMSPNWKKKFLAGYDSVITVLQNNGIKQGDIYLYPFDEVVSSEVDTYIKFVDWIRSERNNAKIFTTVINDGIPSRLKGRPDIVQLYRGANILKDAGKAGEKETWLYDIMNNSKSVPPYSRYRLLAWKAFDLDLQGVGFWAYGDVRGNEEATAWNDFDGNTGDYAVVYELGNSILSSRRWEAFKAGIEDYILLEMFAGKFGEKEAKALSRRVLDNPHDGTLAGKIRMQMIQKLADFK